MNLRDGSEANFQKNLLLWAKTCPKESIMLPYLDTTYLIDAQTLKGEDNLQYRGKKESFFYHCQKGALEEAQSWFQSLNLNKLSLICVYGVGLGYYYDASLAWLKKNRKRRLVFFEDDLGVIFRLLKTERGTKILQNSQVHLIFFRSLKDGELFENFYWNFALTRLAFSCLNSYFEKKQSTFSELRHKIAYDFAMKNALVDEYLRYGVSYYLNFYQNMLSFPGSYLANMMFGKFHKVPAIICGAGPSLAKNLHVLKNLLDRAIIFAGGSALNVLNSAGFQPNFGAGIDPNPMQFERLNANQAFEVPFFYRNRMHHRAFEMIHGPRLYITGAGGYDTAEYFEKELKIGEETVLDEGHNVINFCVEIAHAMGCDPIIFVGMDLAFTGMKEYAPGVVEDAEILQSAILDVEEEDDKAILKKDIFGKPIFTLWKWVAEAEWISTFAKEHPHLTMINATEGGLGFSAIENKTLKDVAEEYLNRSFELSNRIHGEIQNSTLGKIVSHAKVVRLMKNLQKSLGHVLDDFKVLIEDAHERVQKIKNGKKEIIQSGKAALAETELSEELAYKYIIGVFNEVYTRILSREAHDIHVHRLSEKQRQLKKLSLTIKKCTFLRTVSEVNREIINFAFQERKKRRPLKNSIPQVFEISEMPSTYQFNGEQLTLIDKEMNLDIQEIFTPVFVPEKREDGLILDQEHRLSVLYNESWKLSECVVTRNDILNGQSLIFYNDGSVKEEVFYREGKLHGPSTFWNNQGQILAKSWFLNGMREGKSWWYYPSGALYSLQKYRENKWHGEQVFYYPNGSLKTLMNYNKGILVDNPILFKADGSIDRIAKIQKN